MVKVQEGALGPFDDYVVALIRCVVHIVLDRADEWLETSGPVPALVEHTLDFYGLSVVPAGNNGVVMPENVLHPRIERLQVHQVCGPDPDSAGLIGVRGTYAPAGGADGAVSLGCLEEVVHYDVVRHHQVGALADEYPTLDIYAATFDPLNFVQKRVRSDDDSVSDVTLYIGPENAAGHQVEDELALVVNDSMSGVVSAGKPRDDVGVPGQQHVYYLSQQGPTTQVLRDYLSLGLVSPLPSKYRANSHVSSFSLVSQPRIQAQESIPDSRRMP